MTEADSGKFIDKEASSFEVKKAQEIKEEKVELKGFIPYIEWAIEEKKYVPLDRDEIYRKSIEELAALNAYYEAIYKGYSEDDAQAFRGEKENDCLDSYVRWAIKEKKLILTKLQRRSLDDPQVNFSLEALYRFVYDREKEGKGYTEEEGQEVLRDAREFFYEKERVRKLDREKN